MPVQVEPVEALLLTVHMGAWLMIVMVAVLLATILPVSSKKRKYTPRRPKEDPTAPLCPGCPYGYRRMTKSGTTYKPTCKKCAVERKNGRTRGRSSSASEEDGAAESSQQGNTGTSASTLRRSSGDILSPRPNHAGRAPRGHTWNGKEYQADDPSAPQNVARRTHARGGRGFSGQVRSGLLLWVPPSTQSCLTTEVCFGARSLLETVKYVSPMDTTTGCSRGCIRLYNHF